jgi:hypothetical protein
MANKREESMSKENAAYAPAPVPATKISRTERAAIIDRTAGSLTTEEGDELARIIEETCERVDEHD